MKKNHDYKKIAELFDSTVKNMPPSELKVLRNWEETEFRWITTDGWVITDKWAAWDNWQDCTIIWKQKDLLEATQERYWIGKQEMWWILWVSRPTYDKMLEEKSELTYKQYLTLRNVITGF